MVFKQLNGACKLTSLALASSQNFLISPAFPA